MPFEVPRESEQSGWRYRLREDGPELVLQVHQDDDWSDMYGFVPEPAPRVDIEVNNWYTATHPESSFVTSVMAGLRSPDRCLTLFVNDNAVLIERPVGCASSVTGLPLSEVPDLLSSRFGIPNVALTENGTRLTLRDSGHRG